ncbi:hypothetical protein LTR53_014558 [Teratosphaeriaceae sp. CCFEE 6253]|nr:hypothetical protein LTR53_014558 [Teratosphaeriaceae sp. CCFEE 6253]
MDRIFYAIQDFAITAARGTEIDFSVLPLDVQAWAATYVPGVERMPKKLARYILTALVAKTLTARFDPKNFFGLPAKQGTIDAAAHLAKSFAGADAVETKSWLESTWRLLATTDGLALQSSDAALVEDIVREVHVTLSPAMHGKWPSAAPTKLRKISASAIELFRAMHRSKAVFNIHFMEAKAAVGTHVFEPNLMQAVANADEDGAIENMGLLLSAFPAVFKSGDEMGHNREKWTLICKAKMLLQESL